MRIAFVTTHLTTIGGAGKFLMNYANKLSERGHNITIVAQIINRNNYEFYNKISLIEIGGPLPSNPIYWLSFNIIKKKYIKALSKLKVDLIVSQLFPTNYYCADFCKKNNIKHIYYCFEPFRVFHDKKFYSNTFYLLRIIFFFLRIFFKKFDIIAGHKADEIIYISKFVKKKGKILYNKSGYVHYIGVNIDNNINKCIDFDPRLKLKLNEDIPLIFTLGLSHHMKGTKELIYIFSKILKKIPEVVLLIGGVITKSNKKIIKRLIKKLEIPLNNIILYGLIPDDFLNNFYKSSTLTFYTAIHESYGLIPLESMKNGTPIIAFEGGPSETIIDGKTGYIIKNLNISKFSEKALTLLNDSKLIQEFSKASIEHVKNNYNINESVSKLIIIFKNVISK